MNYRMLGYVLGRIFMVEAALLLPPSIVAVIHGEWSCLFAFVVTAGGGAGPGLVLGGRGPPHTAVHACGALFGGCAAPPTRRSMRARVL